VERAVTSGEHQQVRRNTFASVTYFITNAAIALWLVPYLINRIGVDGYGLVVLGLSLTAYVNLAAGSVNASISRFLTVDINRGEFDRANETFNTALFGALLGAGIVLPLLWIFGANVASIVSIPERYSDSAALFVILLVSAFISTFLRNIFTVPAFARNRLDLIYLCQGIDLLVRILVLVTLMSLLVPDVWYVGAGVLSGALAAFAFSVLIWRLLAPYLTLSTSSIRRSRLSELFTMSSWVMVNSTGALLFLNVDLIVANQFLGTEAAGPFGAILQIVIALRSAAGLLAGIVAPLLFARYAVGKFDELESLLKRSMRYLGIALAGPIGIVCAWSGEFLTLWLGPEFAHLKWIIWITTVHLAANLACRPLFFLQQAANRVKNPAIVTLALGFLHVALSIALAWGLGLGLYGIAISGALTLTAKNCIYTVFNAATILDQPSRTFLMPIVVTVLATVLAVALGKFALMFTEIASWTTLILAAVTTAFLYLIAVWRLLLSNDDRNFVRFAAVGSLRS
jgi:O-antigen/teichoic acid export membrane protein